MSATSPWAPSSADILATLKSELVPFGLITRGGFHPHAEDESPLKDAGSVILIGNAGAAMWRAFALQVDGAPHPLNRWTKAVIDPVATRFGATALYPFDDTPWPFQRWARRAEAVHHSPLGILIHPEYGLWHAYRAALLFAERLPLPPLEDAASPCESCAEKPCLSACPVNAFDGVRYDVPACADYLARDERSGSADCLDAGCHARNACPVGAAWRYEPAQIRFHMAAFARSVVPARQP